MSCNEGASWWRIFSCTLFFSSRRRHTRCSRDWSSDVCSSDLHGRPPRCAQGGAGARQEEEPRPRDRLEEQRDARGVVGLGITDALMLDAIGWIILLGLVLGPVAYFALRSYHNKEDKARRQAKSEAYDQREQDRLRAALFRDIHGFFPSLAGRFNDLVSSGVSNNEAVFQAIEETPGVVVGTVFGSLPALLAEPDRRRHLYTIGKTGSGKTTLLLNLIKVDLDAGRGVGVIAPHAELFRDWLLPLIPEDRAEDVIYFAPGNPKNTVSFNPLAVEDGHDRGRASDELMTVFKRALGEEEFGARMT